MAKLALDLAKRTGYAIRFDTGKVKVGEWNLGRGKVGGFRTPVMMDRLWNRLDRLFNTIHIDSVIFEETFAPGKARFQLDSLQYATLLFVTRAQVRWIRIQPTSWKKVIVGNAKAKRDEYFLFAERQWPEIPMWTDNHAAAVCLLAYLEKMDAIK